MRNATCQQRRLPDVSIESSMYLALLSIQVFQPTTNYIGRAPQCILRRPTTSAERRGVLSQMTRSKANTVPAPTATRWRKSRKRRPNPIATYCVTLGKPEPDNDGNTYYWVLGSHAVRQSFQFLKYVWSAAPLQEKLVWAEAVCENVSGLLGSDRVPDLSGLQISLGWNGNFHRERNGALLRVSVGCTNRIVDVARAPYNSRSPRAL